MINRDLVIHCITCFLIIMGVLNTPASADKPEFNGGHAKYLFQLNQYSDDRLFADFVVSSAHDHNGDIRFKFNWKTGPFQLVTDYQLIAQQGDSITLANSLPGQVFITNPALSDDARLFDLTHVMSQDNNSLLAHRLDRLYVDIAESNIVVRLGRQAVSWGNGLIYAPMDFFNPFDPATVDKEYKTGDDMLYGQYLRHNGDDLQAVWVVRRDRLGHVSNEADSIAIKYHGFASDKEYDLLLAEHFGNTIFGIGGLANVSDAVWRGDITLTSTRIKNVSSLVTSLSYSWVSWGYNVSGVMEYFYNGFGQTHENYRSQALAQNPELVERIVRGELFTLGRHYVVASALIEMTPLWLLTPNVFVNVSDGSFLAQLTSTYDFKQDWQLLASLSIPMGASGTEFGGIDSGIAGKLLGTDLNLFVQLAWYY